MTDKLSNKPRLDFWQIWNMSFGFLGIQFGWGLQMANMSAIYEYLGARPDQIPHPVAGRAADRIDRAADHRPLPATARGTGWGGGVRTS